jgi:hypothetical protein
MSDRDRLLAIAREMEETAFVYEGSCRPSRLSSDMRRWASTLEAVAGSATPTGDNDGRES